MCNPLTHSGKNCIIVSQSGSLCSFASLHVPLWTGFRLSHVILHHCLLCVPLTITSLHLLSAFISVSSGFCLFFHDLPGSLSLSAGLSFTKFKFDGCFNGRTRRGLVRVSAGNVVFLEMLFIQLSLGCIYTTWLKWPKSDFFFSCGTDQICTMHV